ncbi:MAG: hypothetical protein ACLRVU_02740 [Beduini sp.]|uniref:hypothetical protein n=1 Tax=Beduini sp. TaxID=1922300 RepID=UPI00399FC329
MMNKESRGFHMGIGASTIFMIFVVLVMFILAILSYLRANSSYEAMMRQMELTSDYYQSEAKLLDLYYGLDSTDLQQDLVGIEYQYLDDEYILQEPMMNGRILKLTFKVEENQLVLLSLKTENMEE